jgi:hypothetical protein
MVACSHLFEPSRLLVCDVFFSESPQHRDLFQDFAASENCLVPGQRMMLKVERSEKDGRWIAEALALPGVPHVL